MKWVLIFTLLLLYLLTPAKVSASTSADVTITATGTVIGAPVGFTLTYISDYEIGISWTKPPNANNTLIRAAYGRIPTNRNDGYLVYYGTNSTATDNSISLATPEVVYYRAWSETASGIWSSLFATGTTEGFMSASFLFIGLLAMALVLTLAAFKWKDMLLSYSAALTWLGIGIWWLLGGITNLSLDDSWTKVLMWIPFMMFAVVMLQLMNTEIKFEAKDRGMGWSEWGRKPTRKESTAYDKYRDELRARVRPRRRGRR